tara:strand:+ start:199 stop:588 length:390 start_codon:yes stop_codon:yes gene_type:complete
MPYALIPDGYTLKKVTKAQEKAVKDLRRSEYVKEIVNNETTLPLLISSIFAIAGGILIDRFLSELELPTLPTLGPEAIEEAKKKAISTTVDFQKINPLFAPLFIADKALTGGKGEEAIESGLMSLLGKK